MLVMLAIAFAWQVKHNAHDIMPHDETANSVKINQLTAEQTARVKIDSTEQMPFDGNLNVHASDAEMNRFLKHWINKNPHYLAEQIMRIEDEKSRLKILALALKIWHSSDPKGLHNWGATVKANASMTTFCRTHSFIPRLCIKYAEQMIGEEPPNNIVEYQLKHWVATDVEGAISWCANDDDSFRRYGVDVFRHAIEIDFDEALFSLSLLISADFETSSEVADLIVKKLYGSRDDRPRGDTKNDINTVANSILSLPDSQLRDMFLLSIAPFLFQYGDSYNSMVLLEALSESPARDSLQHSFVGWLTERQGEQAALAYLAQISNREKKQELMSTVVVRWGKDDIFSAHHWFTSWHDAPTETAFSLTEIAIAKENISIAKALLDKIRNETGSKIETAEYDFQLAKLMHKQDSDSAVKYLEQSIGLAKHDQERLKAYLTNGQ